MIQLIEDSLGKRHRELNLKVAETVKKKICFDDVKSMEEKSDVDRLYKIDVASQYKNIDYIVEIMKCGDSLLISRALNFDWIFDDEYSHIMNPDYLHNEIFPLMSLKMKTKLLNKLAYHVKNETRTECFSTYCKYMKMKPLFFKFFSSTSEAFKLKLIKEDCYYLSEDGYPPIFIGNSFSLAEECLTADRYIFQKESFIDSLAYLYHVDENKYLDLLEKYAKLEGRKVSIGCRLSKNIMTKHKHRVLKDPLLYINKIKKHILIRYTTTQEDAKIYIPALLPPNVKTFWDYDFYYHNKYLFDLIPYNEIYEFLKTIFKLKYGDVLFEMHYSFYDLHYYRFLTEEEKESWALKHIEEAKEILGSNNDYIWYKFVNFTEAFPNIKKYILITPDIAMRNRMVMVLIDSVRNKQDLETLINYYHKRHINESVEYKTQFLNGITNSKHIFECDDSSWMVFNKILCSVEILKPGYLRRHEYSFFFVIHNIIRGIEMDSTLIDYINTNMNICKLAINLCKLNTNEKKSVYEYLFKYYFKQFKCSIKWDLYETQNGKNRYARYLYELLECFKKAKENLPVDVSKFMNSSHCQFRFDEVQNEPEKIKESPYRLETLTESCLMRLLKKDKEAETIIQLRPEIDNCSLKMTKFLKKIKIYYSHDLANAFLEYYLNRIEDLLISDDRRSITNAVYGIFCLGNEEHMLKLLLENIPEEPKIDHSKIDVKLLTIQEAICRYACYSRVAVPLSAILPYIKGDYVQFCLPMFNRYLCNLPMPLVHKFIESILNAPLSVQKHGIRLAFTAFSTENLKNLLSNVWKKTKNVSLRMIIYKELFAKIIKSNDEIQNELYQVIRELNLSLHDEDQQEVFNLLVSYEIPERFKGDYLESAWISVKQLPNKAKNMAIKIKLINEIERHLDCINRDFVLKESQEHVHKMVLEREIRESYTDHENTYNDCLWNLTARYIISSKTDEDCSKSLLLTITILREYYEQWNYESNKPYVVNKNLIVFIGKLKERSELTAYKFSKYNVQIFEKILCCIQDMSPVKENYMSIIDLKIYIIAKKATLKKCDDDDEPDILSISNYVTEELVVLMNEIKKYINCFTVFYKNIEILIKQIFSRMSSLSRINAELLLAHVSKELLTLGGNDNTFLALSLMPLNISTTFDREKAEFEKLCIDFTNKVRSISVCEIEIFYYTKFVSDDFENRFK